MDTLKKAIDVYYINEKDYPISDKINLPEGNHLLGMIKSTGDSGAELYKVDLKKSGKYHTRLKHGYEKSVNDYFIYSLETHQLFYAKGVMNGEGKYVYGYNMSGLKNVMLGDTPLIPDQQIEVDAGDYVLTGEVPLEETVEVYVNGKSVPVSYEEKTARVHLVSVYAGEDSTIYKKFKAHISFQSNKAYTIKVVTSKEETNYQIQTNDLGPIRWHGLPGEAFDGNSETFVDINQSTEITWDGDLTGKVIYIDARDTSYDSFFYMYIKDSNDNNLDFFYTDGTKIYDYRPFSFSVRQKFSIVMPENAAKIVFVPFHNSKAVIYDVYEAEDLSSTQPVQNISAVPDKTSITLNWTNPDDENFEKVYILRDNELLGTSTTGTFTDIGLHADTPYTYELVALNTTGNWSESKSITSITLSRAIDWYGVDGAAVDGDSETSATIKGETTITWDGNLSGKVVHIDAKRIGYDGTVYMYIRDDNDKNLSFFNTDGTKIERIGFPFNKRQTLSIVIPENATKIYFAKASHHKVTIFDIYEADDLTSPLPVENIKAVSDKTSITLNWTNPDNEDFKEVYVLRNNELIGSSMTGSFTDTGLYANTEYTYQLIAVDTTGNWSESKFISAKTLERDIYWHGLSGEAFDGNETTYYKGTGTVTWDGDLTRKVVHIDVMRISVASTSVYNYYMYIRDENNKNLVFYDTDGNSMTSKNFPKNNRQTFSIVMPEGASKIVFSSSQGTANVYDVCEADDLIPTAPVSNLTGVPAETTVTLNWTNPNDDDFKTVWIFRDGVRIGASSTGTFADTKGLSADTEYSYQIYAVDETGNLSEPTEITIKTLMQ